MTPHRPLIVVTLPGRSIDAVRSQLERAKDAGADAAELRADRLPAAEMARVGELFPSALPLVATYRSRAEGGEAPEAAGSRETALLALAAHPFRWLDVELARDRELLARLPPTERLGRIISCHIEEMAGGAWRRRLAELEDVDGLGKLVVRARLDETLRQIVPEAGRVGGEVVVLTTGPSGPLLRAWSRRLGYPIVYAALPEGSPEEAVEPSQVPVDRLRPFLDAEETPPLYGVCGHPVGHSLSPQLHGRWMRADGELGLYLALEPESDREFLDVLEPLAESGFRGLNVTQPFKAVAAKAATELGAGARACGAANCLTFRDGAVLAENTDLLAVLRRLEELKRARVWDGQTVTVVGAGGAARATLAAARELGAAATVYARRRTAAEALAGPLGARVGSKPEPATLVVHATEVGREDGPSLDVPIAELLGRGGHLLDWVYRPKTPLLRRIAEAAGATYEDGWGLLVQQAASSYEIWWGHPPPPEAVAEALRERGSCAA
jgi:shikimate dehydrogenase